MLRFKVIYVWFWGIRYMFFMFFKPSDIDFQILRLVLWWKNDLLGVGRNWTTVVVHELLDCFFGDSLGSQYLWGKWSLAIQGVFRLLFFWKAVSAQKIIPGVVGLARWICRWLDGRIKLMARSAQEFFENYKATQATTKLPFRSF